MLAAILRLVFIIVVVRLALGVWRMFSGGPSRRNFRPTTPEKNDTGDHTYDNLTPFEIEDAEYEELDEDDGAR